MLRNLNQAVERYSNLPGVKFTEPTDSVLCIEAPAIRQSENIKVVTAYSRAHPPYLELTRAGGNGIFSPKNVGQMLYFRIWESDLETRMGKLKQQGIGIDALIRPACHKPPNRIIPAPDPMDGA